MKKLLLLLTLSTSIFAANIDFSKFSTSLEFAQVTKVTAFQKPDRSWCFSTTVHHNDQDWDHYADGWEVVDLKGNQLGFRLLGHPHDNEQPFTRNLCNVQIPNDVKTIVVRAKCNKHGYGGKPVIIDLSVNDAKDYTVRWEK